MSGRLRVALAQVDCALGDVEENARRASAEIARAQAAGADLLVFPELSLSGYALGATTEDVALRRDDPLLAGLAAEAAPMGLVLGFVEDGPVHTYNSAIHLEDGKVAHVHRKAYLPTYGRFEEHKHFRPGEALRAYDTRWGRFGLLICNDAWQPPLPFLAIHAGARLLIIPTCSSLEPGGAIDSGSIADDWGDLLHHHARFLQTWIVFVNRVGEEAGMTFWGGSRVVDPWGRIVAEAPREEQALLVVDIDLAAVRQARRQMPLVKEPRLEFLARELERLAADDG
jgi:predicted amidohydrolase